MRYLCVWDGAYAEPALTTWQTTLLAVVPRLMVQREICWADLGGLPISQTVDRVVHVLRTQGREATHIGVADTPIAAEVAARYGSQSVTSVPTGEDQAFLAGFPVSVLQPDSALANLLDGIGIEVCGDLARLTCEAVEVRCGAVGARLWRLARADDPRRIFEPIPRGLPEASVEWTDYTLRRADRLLFVLNRLCGTVCEALRTRGDGAVQLTLRFSLANRTVYEHPVRIARATARHVVWMRVIRLNVEELVLPDAVVGIAIRVEQTAGLGGQQGDMFDRGFGTVQAAEDSVGALLDDHGAVVVEPIRTAHPLIERRTSWTPVSALRAVSAHDPAERASDSSVGSVTLTLQVLPQPRRITVATIIQQGREVPRSYRDINGTHTLKDVGGPDYVSGEQWDNPYARAYFRGVTTKGLLVWLYREMRTGVWYFHGWWD